MSGVTRHPRIPRPRTEPPRPSAWPLLGMLLAGVGALLLVVTR